MLIMHTRKWRKRRAKDRAKIMELVATDLANGKTPHPQLLTYVLDRNKFKPPVLQVKKAHKHRKNFYQSQEWRELRYRALTIHGARCQACRSKNGPMHVDHIKPRSKFPKLALDIHNVQVLCEDCNMGKSNKSCEDWR